MSATPIPNGPSDWSGYTLFVEHQDASHWWSKQSLAAMEFEADMNPFDLDDGHPAARLQLTRKTYQDWILRPDVDPVDKGKRLARNWKRVLLRRTNLSCIPLDGGKWIRENLPRVKAAFINCTHCLSESHKYIEFEEEALGTKVVLGSTSKAQKKPKWSLGTHRRLSMATMWLGLPDLDSSVNLKAAKLKTTLEDSRFYTEWFLDHDIVDMANPHPYLHELLDGSPKIRALLRNVRSQVSGPGG